MRKEQIAFMLFTAKNGQRELFAGKNRPAIMADTKGGRDFGGCDYISSQFLSFYEAEKLKIEKADIFDKAVKEVLAGELSFFIGKVASFN
jgi:hypothetical protein